MNQLQASRELFSIYKSFSGEEDLTFEEFILGSMIKTLKSSTFKETRALIESLLIKSYKSAESLNHEMSMGLRNRAMLMYRLYQKEYGNSSAKLPKFRDIDKSAKISLYGTNTEKLNTLEKFLEETTRTKVIKVSTDCALPEAN